MSLTRRQPAASETPPPQKKVHVRWSILTVVAIVHVIGLGGFLLHDWTTFWIWLGMVCVTGCFGVTVGFHRCLTHNSFETVRPMRWLFGLLGCLAGQANVVDWIALHRKHHACSDKPGEDPHTPRDGVWWSHMFWFLVWRSKEELAEVRDKYARKIVKNEPMLCWIGKYHWLWLLLFSIGTAGAGYLINGWRGSLTMVIWCVCIRLIFMWHSTWLVNSVCHLWGYRNYKHTGDMSRNNPLVAALTFGEGFHNNHHGDQCRANHGFHRWWEIDLSYLAIRLLWCVGLAWNIKDAYGVKKAREPAAA